MSLTAKENSGGGDFKILEAGTHAAVCTQIIDIGPQQFEFKGEVKEQDKVKVRFEVPEERVTWKDKEGVEHEGPMTIWMSYTVSLNEKATLRKHLETWRGVAFTEVELMGFHLKNILGKPCLLSVVHKEVGPKTYANIAGISKLPKGMTAPQPEGDLVCFDFDLHTPEEFDALPEWLQKLVTAGKELLAEQRSRGSDATPEPASEGFEDDDIPF